MKLAGEQLGHVRLALLLGQQLGGTSRQVVEAPPRKGLGSPTSRPRQLLDERPAELRDGAQLLLDGGNRLGTGRGSSRRRGDGAEIEALERLDARAGLRLGDAVSELLEQLRRVCCNGPAGMPPEEHDCSADRSRGGEEKAESAQEPHRWKPTAARDAVR